MRLKILLVEDEAIVMMMVSDLIKGIGHEVVEATTAERAVELLSSEPFDVLMTDINLPGMDGKRLANLARETNPKLPVIFASGYIIEQVDVMDAPFSTVSKPYWEEDIKRALSELLETPIVV